MDQLLHSINAIVLLLVIISGVFSVISNFRKATKNDLIRLGSAVDRELKKQKEINAYLQIQLDEKQQHITDLQKQNNIEDEIIEEQYPNIEQTMALLARGQSTILEKLAKIEGGETT